MVLKTGQWGGTSLQVKLTRYWLPKHWGTCMIHCKLTRVYPWMQLVQFPVEISKSPHKEDTLRQILFWIHCLGPHCMSINRHLPSTKVRVELIQLKQAPVKWSKSLHVGLTGKQEPKW